MVFRFAGHLTINTRYCSDGRVVRASASGARLGFDSDSGQTNDFKINIHSFPA